MLPSEKPLKKLKKKNIISFDEEIVSKQEAKKICNDINLQKSSESDKGFLFDFSTEDLESHKPQVKNNDKISKNKKKKRSANEISQQFQDNEKTEIDDGFVLEDKPKKKKKNKATNESVESNQDASSQNVQQEKTESIRARKRKKHAELMKEKKLKTQLALQEKSINYLSNWKYNRDQWKFEKLRQIWLQQNMYDPEKVPEKYWNTLVEYFSNSKGKSREIICKEALKIIEEASEDFDGESIKITRARDLIQNLQE